TGSGRIAAPPRRPTCSRSANGRLPTRLRAQGRDMPATRETPVIVTRREVERLFVEKPAESAIHDAAAEESPMERARAMAMTGAILRELQKAEQAAGSERVMVTAQHGPASRLQSLTASGELGTLELKPLPAGGLEAKFDTQDWAGWSTVIWAGLNHPETHCTLRHGSL